MDIILLIAGVSLVAGIWALITARRIVGGVLVAVALLLALTLAGNTRVCGCENPAIPTATAAAHATATAAANGAAGR